MFLFVFWGDCFFYAGLLLFLRGAWDSSALALKNIKAKLYISRSFVSIFEVNLEEFSALALKNIKASFIFLARLLVSLQCEDTLGGKAHL